MPFVSATLPDELTRLHGEHMSGPEHHVLPRSVEIPYCWPSVLARLLLVNEVGPSLREDDSEAGLMPSIRSNSQPAPIRCPVRRRQCMRKGTRHCTMPREDQRRGPARPYSCSQGAGAGAANVDGETPVRSLAHELGPQV
ncbi:hypothetical protein PG997_008322 [Apiospora hydei]|uniref:Uncharacterized protein n=1 Tax=Apiospora hydei TaxID=1337664 RepID=A0ABR1WAG7_9PEZI